MQVFIIFHLVDSKYSLLSLIVCFPKFQFFYLLFLLIFEYFLYMDLFLKFLNYFQNYLLLFVFLIFFRGEFIFIFLYLQNLLPKIFFL